MQRCMEGQKVAHLIARLMTNEDTNLAIRDSLVIAGKRMWARRMWKEPQRCLKCQSITARHLAASCNQQATFSTCGKDHCTLECSDTDRAAFWMSGHGSSNWASMTSGCQVGMGP